MKRLDLTGLPVFADLDAPDPELDEIESRQVSTHGIISEALQRADAVHKLQKEAKKLHAQRLSDALTGVPHGPYVPPTNKAWVPARPGEFVDDSPFVYPFDVTYDGERHRFGNIPRIPAHEVRGYKKKKTPKGTVEVTDLIGYKPILNGRNANRYMKAYKAYLQALNDYDNGEGQQWETYKKRYADYEKKLGAYNERINKRDTAREDRANKKRIARNRKMAKNAFTKSQDWNGVNYAGYAPWSDKYGEFKRLKSKEYKDIGANYHVMKHPPKKTITLSNGRRVRVIDSDLGVPLGFSQMFGYNGASEVASDEKTGLTSADYVEEAFSGKHKTHDWEGDCGHIVGVHYSAYYQLLQINFRTGDTCTYFRVPSTVAGELLTFAKNGSLMHSAVDGTDRHALGIRFWDLVRIRGTKHGSRYRFEYGSGGSMSSYQRKWAYAPVMQLDGGQSGYDIEKLKTWKENYVKEHGRMPSPDEFKDKIAELHVESGGKRNTGMSDDMYVEGKYQRVAQSYDPVDIDMLDDYFENRYKQDLGYKSIDSKKLQQAYAMYNNMDLDLDANEIAKIIRSAGAVI